MPKLAGNIRPLRWLWNNNSNVIVCFEAKLFSFAFVEIKPGRLSWDIFPITIQLMHQISIEMMHLSRERSEKECNHLDNTKSIITMDKEMLRVVGMMWLVFNPFILSKNQSDQRKCLKLVHLFILIKTIPQFVIFWKNNRSITYKLYKLIRRGRSNSIHSMKKEQKRITRNRNSVLFVWGN